MQKFAYREVRKLEEKDLYELLKIEPIDPKIIEDFEKQCKGKTAPSKKFKKKMNRMFREKLGIMRIPHPEVDNFFERWRSKIVIALSRKK